MEWEKEIGIGAYLYNERCDGWIKDYPDDFIVEEEGVLGKAELRILKGLKAKEKPEGSGEYLYVVMEKRDWDTNDVIQTLARKLHISTSRISFAGTKDKYALTSQWISLWRVKWNELKDVKIKDVAFHSPVYMRKKLRRGQLKGNWFEVRVRGCSLQWAPERFLNYFGHQRFGSYRFVSHIVGRYLLLEDYEDAALEYLTRSSPWEPEETRRARERLKKELDFKEALNYFPKNLRKERRILAIFLESGSWKSAILSLPKNLISLFIHAYQSFIFNKALTETAGSEEYLIVPGHRLFPKGSVEKELLDEDGIEQSHFKRWKRFGTYGEYRKSIESVDHLNVKSDTLSFYLSSGSYATSYLRELLKPSSPVGFLISRLKVRER